MNDRIYLDNSATTKVDPNSLEIMNYYHSVDYGNPSSLHRMGMAGEKKMEEARETIASLFKAKPRQIVFTSGGTEGNNLILRGVIEKYKTRKSKIITSKMEHPSVLEVLKEYEEQGLQVVYLEVNQWGDYNEEELLKEVDSDTMLVSMMKVNNETGKINDLKKIRQICDRKNPECLIHSDWVQALGKIATSPVDEGVDFATTSGHKVHGPKGVGFMYIKNQQKLQSVMKGGGQENGIRSGTQNVPAIAGFEEALKNARSDHAGDIRQMKQKILTFVDENIEEVSINSPLRDDFSDHIISLSFNDVKGEILLHSLEQKGVYVSTGSACSSKKEKDSPVIKAMGIPDEYRKGTIRISLSKYNSVDEMGRALQILKEEVKKIRKVLRR